MQDSGSLRAAPSATSPQLHSGVMLASAIPHAGQPAARSRCACLAGQPARRNTPLGAGKALPGVLPFSYRFPPGNARLPRVFPPVAPGFLSFSLVRPDRIAYKAERNL